MRRHLHPCIKYSKQWVPCSPDSELSELKNKVSDIDVNKWKKARQIVNSYEFKTHHTIINRSFYKFWEIIKRFNLDTTQTSLFCAEAPGGFIQAAYMHSQRTKKPKDDDEFKLVTIKNKRCNFTISKEKRMYHKKIKRHAVILSDDQGLGDLTDLKNMELLADRKFHLISADGGFDNVYTLDKETSHYHLIAAQILYALSFQEEKGDFVIKIFDTVTVPTIHLLYLLNIVYKDMYIYKPLTSRSTNSEKYVVCKTFKSRNDMDSIIRTLKAFILDSKEGDQMTMFENIPISFSQQMNTINKSLIENQKTFLKQAITISMNPDFDNIYKTRKTCLYKEKEKRYIDWANKYEFFLIND